MTFEEYWKSLSGEAKNKLAEQTGIERQYLYQLGTGRRKPGLYAAFKLLEVLPQFTLQDLRPDILRKP